MGFVKCHVDCVDVPEGFVWASLATQLLTLSESALAFRMLNPPECLFDPVHVTSV